MCSSDLLNIRRPVRYTVRTDPTLNVQGSTESSVPLVLTKQYGVDMSFTSADYALSIDDFSDRFIKPALSALANKIDFDGLALYSDVYNAVGTPGTTPTSQLTYLQARALLNNEAAPQNDRSICLNPTAEITIVSNLTALFNPNKQISDQYIKGSMGTAFGFDWYMDQNVNTQVFGTYAANVAGGAVTVTNAVTSGTSIVTGGWTAGDVLNAGDIVTFGTLTSKGVYAINPQSRTSTGLLRQFVVASQSTADVSGNMTIIIANPTLTFTGAYQTCYNVNNAIEAGAVVGVFSASGKSSPQNLAYQKDAFTFATAKLPEMPGVKNGFATAPELGMSVRIIDGYDIVNDRKITRLDLLGGWKTIRPELAVRIAG